MKIKDVAKLDPVERLLYWIRERHSIYLKRKAGKPPPWTDDEVLQTVFFTNPYRENDKTTVWFRDNVREPLRDDARVLMATVIFRWFNYIPTGGILLKYDLLTKWSQSRCVKALKNEQKIFTGAFMIVAGAGSKLEGVAEAINNVWKRRERLLRVCSDDCRMQTLWSYLCDFPYLGGFMSYEIVCDLRYTYLLENATDKDTWCNIGPGAKRGFNRVYGRPLNASIPPDLWAEKTQELLKLARAMKLKPRMEMREIEHSLCEGDKYERSRLGDGHLKRKYQGT